MIHNGKRSRGGPLQSAAQRLLPSRSYLYHPNKKAHSLSCHSWNQTGQERKPLSCTTCPAPRSFTTGSADLPHSRGAHLQPARWTRRDNPFRSSLSAQPFTKVEPTTTLHKSPALISSGQSASPFGSPACPRRRGGRSGQYLITRSIAAQAYIVGAAGRSHPAPFLLHNASYVSVRSSCAHQCQLRCQST